VITNVTANAFENPISLFRMRVPTDSLRDPSRRCHTNWEYRPDSTFAVMQPSLRATPTGAPGFWRCRSMGPTPERLE
jgi:hypothetical protein